MRIYVSSKEGPRDPRSEETLIRVLDKHVEETLGIASDSPFIMHGRGWYEGDSEPSVSIETNYVDREQLVRLRDKLNQDCILLVDHLSREPNGYLVTASCMTRISEIKAGFVRGWTAEVFCEEAMTVGHILADLEAYELIAVTVTRVRGEFI